MGVIRYTAIDRNRMISTHSEGTEYEIEIDFNSFIPVMNPKVKNIKSLSGVGDITIFNRVDHEAPVSTIWIDDVDIQKAMHEFYDSISNGSEFELDPYGTILDPVETYTGKLRGTPSQVRFEKMERFSYKFTFSYKPIETSYPV